MLKFFICFLVLSSFSFSYGQQTCYESKPPQLNLSCEYVGGNIKLRIEILDVKNSSIKKQDVYMGDNFFGSDWGSRNCESQMQLLKSTLVSNVIQKPQLIALCEDIGPTLVRIILKPQAPYVSIIDKTEMSSSEKCLREMNSVNTQQ